MSAIKSRKSQTHKKAFIFLNSSVGDVCDRHQWWKKGAKRSGSNKENFEAIAKKATMLQQGTFATAACGG